MNIRTIIQESMIDMAHHKTALIAFLGDSVTQGCFELYRSQSGAIDTVFRNDLGYHAKLKQLFDIMFPRASVNILNAGISGDNAVNGARRVGQDVISHRPQLAVVCYGLNDSSRGKTCVEDYINGLASIFHQLKDAEIDIIFMTPNMKANYPTKEMSIDNTDALVKSIADNQLDGTMDLYMEKAIELCRAEGVTVCDCYGKWKKLSSYGADITRLLSNRLNHPVEQMHWLFAWSLFQTIMEI